MEEEQKQGKKDVCNLKLYGAWRDIIGMYIRSTNKFNKNSRG